MKFSTTTSAIAVAIIALAGTAQAADYSANIELDSTARSGTQTKDTTDAGLTQSGRVELNATGKAGTGITVSGKAAFLAKKDGTAAIDDMWVSVNNAAGSGLKLGRFEATDLFPIAQDTVVNNAGVGGVYGTNLLRGRKDSNQFHAAGTLALGGGLAIELGLVETKQASTINGTGLITTPIAKGIRPVVTYASGPLSLAAGLETGNILLSAPPVADKVKFTGFGFTGGYDFGGFKLTGDFATAKVKTTAEQKRTSFALTAQVASFAGGLIAAKNALAGGANEKITTLYASYKLPLFDVKDAFITPALSISKATDAGNVAGASLKDTSVRVRINYTF